MSIFFIEKENCSGKMVVTKVWHGFTCRLKSVPTFYNTTDKCIIHSHSFGQIGTRPDLYSHSHLFSYDRFTTVFSYKYFKVLRNFAVKCLPGQNHKKIIFCTTSNIYFRPPKAILDSVYSLGIHTRALIRIKII